MLVSASFGIRVDGDFSNTCGICIYRHLPACTKYDRCNHCEVHCPCSSQRLVAFLESISLTSSSACIVSTSETPYIVHAFQKEAELPQNDGIAIGLRSIYPKCSQGELSDGYRYYLALLGILGQRNVVECLFSPASQKLSRVIIKSFPHHHHAQVKISSPTCASSIRCW